MPVKSLGLSAVLSWQLERANAGFAPTVQGADAAAFANDGLDVAVWDAVFTGRWTLAAGATQAVDLRAYTDLAGNAITADKVIAVLVLVTGAAADKLRVEPHGTDGLQWFFETATGGIEIPGGGMFLFSEGPASAGAVVSATARQLLLTNLGAASLTVKVVAIESDT